MKRHLALITLLLAGIAGTALASNTAESDAALKSALTSYNAGKVRAARVEVMNAVKANPKNALARAIHGRVLVALGDGEAAQTEFTKALELGMPMIRISHLIGEAAFIRGDMKTALERTLPANVHPMFEAYNERLRARIFMATGDLNAAGQHFQNALRLTPKSSPLMIDYGRYRLMNGNLAGAIEASDKAVALATKNSDALVFKGEMVRQQYGLTASIPFFEKALAADQSNLIAKVELAATLGDAGRNQDMLQMTRRILAQDGNNPQAFYLQAVLAARANQPSLARALLYKTNGRLDGMPSVMLLRATIEIMKGADDQAVARLRPLLALQPTNIKVRRLLGAALWRMGDVQGTINTLSPLVNRGDVDSYTLTLLGRALEAEGDRQTAALVLDRAQNPAPINPTPFGRFAPIPANLPSNSASVAVPLISGLIANGQYGDAMARANALQSQNPGAPAALIVLGDSYQAAGRLGDAIEAYRKAANLRFSEPTALRLVRALERAGKPNEAIIVLDTFMAQNPRSIPARRLASEVMLRSGQWDRAITLLDNLRDRLGDRDVAILNNLAWAHYQKKDAETAHSYAAAAYRLAPNNAAITSTYGTILSQGKINRTMGLTLLQKAIALAPQNPTVRYELGRAYAALGQNEDAKAALKLAIANPNFGNKAEANKLLAGL
jgi:cellulose synthase operon protein C